MHADIWLHWFMAAFFAITGVWFVAKRRCFSSSDSYGDEDDAYEDATERRLAAVYLRRAQRARERHAPGLELAGLAFVLAVLNAMTGVSPALLYALFVVSLAVTIAVATGSLRRSNRRAASLEIRKRNEAVPVPVLLVVFAAACVPLVWVLAEPGPAIGVTFAGLAIFAIGLRTALRPAELEGNDVRVEAFVDRRVRVARAATLFALAPAPAFVFVSFSGWTDTAPRIAALVISIAACAVSGWRVRDANCRPTPAELAVWLHVAS